MQLSWGKERERKKGKGGLPRTMIAESGSWRISDGDNV